MSISDSLWVKGHPNIRGTHNSTIEFTKDRECTPRGDCILGVEATKSVSEIDEDLKEWIRGGGKVLIRLSHLDLEDEIIGYGSRYLSFEDERSMVIRRSDYIDGRTLAIGADKSAKDVKRALINLLKSPSTKVLVEITSIPT